jgi:uncharacterized small protein (DUF1192 family)
MLLEDDNPSSAAAIGKSGGALHQNLDSLSVAELEGYVAALQAEIKRAEAEIAKKSASRAAAEAVFGKV